MDVQTHWEKIYSEKAPKRVSWYRPHLETSLALIEQSAPGRFASVIDVGGGESTLVDDLLARNYENITVLDISQSAIDANRKRLGGTAEVSIGSSPTSFKSSWSLPPTTCGTTALSFIFLPQRPTAVPISVESPMR
jgi:hypothetical protein